MNVYEALKKMSLEEVAAIFYMFIKPMMDEFNLNDEQKNEVRENIIKMLNNEVKH